MKLEKLKLRSFGKFKAREIDLLDGINLVYGKNEAGKTTLHSFIDGIFYGFLRPYAKRTLYREEHEKYEPWDGSGYGGSLDFKQGDRSYTIERDFTKGREKTSVFDRDTGRDITGEIDGGDGGRVIQPGFHFFGFNEALYLNTISIGQLKSATDQDLANEVRDRLANMSTSRDEEISIERAVESLEASLREIGSERAPTSPYARKVKSQEELSSRRLDLLEAKESYESLMEEDDRLKVDLALVEADIGALERELDQSRSYEDKLILDELDRLDQDLEFLAGKRESLKDYKNLDMDDYLRLVELARDLENLRQLRGDLEKKVGDDELALAGLGPGKEVEENRAAIGYIELEEIKERREALLREKEGGGIEDLRNEVNDHRERMEHNTKLMPMTVLLTILTVVSVFILDSYIMLGLNLFTLPVILYLRSFEKKTGQRLDDLSSRIEEVKEKGARIDQELDSLDLREDEIFGGLGLKTRAEVKRRADRIDLELINQENQERKLAEKQEELESTRLKLEQVVEKIEDLLEEEGKILRANRSKNLQDFKLGLEKKKDYQESLQAEGNKLDLRARILGKRDFDTMKEGLKDFGEDYSYVESEGLKEDLEAKKVNFNKLKLEASLVEERLDQLNKKVGELLEVDEAVDRLDRDLASMNGEREAIKLARDTIVDLSQDIHREFAPEINSRVGRLVDRVTGGKYRDIRIDEDLNISVIHPDQGQLIDLASLSGGTMDQLYFALRFGIIDEIKDRNLPLMLDDCFIQYDDERLEAMISFLAEEARTRQIILFTCQERERLVLDRLGLDYNLIEI